MRPELEPLPPRMQRLPIDARGYPIPWFVPWLVPGGGSGEMAAYVAPETPGAVPEFRAADTNKWVRAIREGRCWVCGDPMGRFKTFVLGPMCGVNRTTSEPPCHRDCAIWSARNCPFLARPHMDRRQHAQLTAMGTGVIGGTALTRNPGVALVWTTRHFSVWVPKPGERLIQVGDPTEVLWFAEGRLATRDEVEDSIAGGVPFLRKVAEEQERREGIIAVAELERQLAAFDRYLPARETSTP